MQKRSLLVVFLAACGLALSGCGETDCPDDLCVTDYGVSPEYTVTRAPVNAVCTVELRGKGTINMEDDYVPHVTWCENGNADEEAVKAQTVSARTYAYYGMQSKHELVDSTDDQVYSCPAYAANAEQLARMKAATKATSGMVLTYHNTIVCAFFVAGSKPEYLNDECKFTGNSSSPGWASTQGYVTYNWGKSGGSANGFTQSSIGYRADTNYANRGCMSQNGAHCLSKKGWKWPDIIKFFYGDDIVMEQAVGDCVEPQKCEIVLDRSGVIIDEMDPCFARSESSAWFSVNAGHDGHLYYTYTMDTVAEVVGTWNFTVTRAGKYEVFVYLQPDVGAVSAQAPYTIRASGTEHNVKLDMTGKSGWVSLGAFDFAEGGDQWVRLNDSTGEKYVDKNGKRIIFDAIKFEDAVTCADACTAGDTQCSEGGLQTCSKQADGCTQWSQAVPCGENQTCSNKRCEDVGCENQCQADGERVCSGNGYQICTRRDDSCSQWGAVQPCDEGKTCVNGACVAPDNPQPPDVPQPPVDPDEPEVNTSCLTAIDGRPETILDDLDSCFVRTGVEEFSAVSNDYGYQDHLYYAFLRNDAKDAATGTWTLNVKKSGKYTIYAYVEDGLGMVVPTFEYTVKASGRVYHPAVRIDGTQSKWVQLGNFDLTAGEHQYVQLGNVLSAANAAQLDDVTKYRVLFDAVRVIPFGSGPSPEDPVSPVDGDDSGNSQAVASESSDCSTGGYGGRAPAGVAALLMGMGAALGWMRRRRGERL